MIGRRPAGASASPGGAAALPTTIIAALLLSVTGTSGLFAQSGPPLSEPPPIEAGARDQPDAYDSRIDVQHYDVELSLREDVPWILGNATLTVQIEATASLSELRLDFTGLHVDLVTVDGVEVGFKQADGSLLIDLDPSAISAGTVELGIAYRGTPDDGLILRGNVRGAPSAFVDNWPNRTRFWLPSVDHPSDKATIRYRVHAPARWQVVANGSQIGEATATPEGALGGALGRRSWVYETTVPISPYNMVVGATDFTVVPVGLAACGEAPASVRSDGCIEVTAWLYPEDSAQAAISFGRAAQMVDHFTSLVGPYPFEKLANVQSATRFGGMENASAIFYSERALSTPNSMEGTVSHEIAHQWFGDAVTEADWSHLWLSEGFATYFGAQFFEAVDGVGNFRERMQGNARRYLTSEDVHKPVISEEANLFSLLNRNNYQKGGWVLHMLRARIGDEAFFRGIRRYYARHLHQAVLTHEFQQVMEEVSRENLESFFQQWLHEPGHPVISIDMSWDAERSEATVSIEQTQHASWPTFELRAELEFGMEAGPTRRSVRISERSSTFRFQLPEAPRSVAFDPDGWILHSIDGDADDGR